MFASLIVGFSYSQENSDNSSGLNFSSPNSKSENSLLNLKKKDNPFLKKLENKKKKDFFPDANVKGEKPERFINSNDFYLSRLNRKDRSQTKILINSRLINFSEKLEMMVNM